MCSESLAKACLCWSNIYFRKELPDWSFCFCKAQDKTWNLSDSGKVNAILFYFILFYFIFLSSPEGERGKETLMWETSISCLSYVTLPTRDWTQTQSCALTSNWACSLLVHGPMLQPPEPHRPGHGEWYFRKFSHKTGPFPDKNNFGLQTLFLLVIGIPYISSLTLYTL